MSVVVCSENRRADWDDLIAQCADATSGHLWQWREVVGSAYGFDSFYLLAQDGRDRPIAAAPFIFVRSFLYGNELASMPYIDYGGVCHADWLDCADRDAAQAELIAHARELAGKLRAKRLHVRSLQQLRPPFEVSTEKVAQHLALASTVDEQLRRLPSERRNRLKRVEKLKLSVDVGDPTDPVALADLCAIYSENQRDLGSPPHGRRFFSELAGRLRDRLSLIRVGSGGRVLAAGLAMNFRGSMTLPWSGATAEARPVYGTNALYWAGIRLGIESRLPYLRFRAVDRRLRHLRIQAPMGPDSGATVLEHAVPFAAGCVAAPSQEPADHQPSVALHAAGSSPHDGTGAATGDLKLSSLAAPRFGIEKAAGEPSRIRRQAYRFIGEIHIPGRIRLNHVFREIKGLGLPESGVRMLDAGTGRGDIALHCARLHPDWRVHGVDLIDERVERCRTAAGNLALRNVTFSRDNLLNLSATAQYDLITNTDVLEHIEDDRGAMANLARALAPGGYLLLTFPSVPQRRHLRLVAWRERRIGFKPEDIGHVRPGYSPEMINALAREVGLEPVKTVWTYGPFGNLAHDLFFVLGDSKPNPIVFAAALPVLLALSFLENHIPTRHGSGLLAIVRKPVNQ